MNALARLDAIVPAEEVGQAWRAAYGVLASTMKNAAHQEKADAFVSTRAAAA